MPKTGPLLPRTSLHAGTIGLAMLFASLLATQGAPVRISFLGDDAVLRDTSELIRECGCTRNATNRFQAAVRNYNSTNFGYDLSKFPELKAGFYHFDSVSNLTRALPHPICQWARHSPDINCFDAVIAVAAGQFNSQPTDRNEEERLSILRWELNAETNQIITIYQIPAKDAFATNYPKWYQDQTQFLFSESIRQQRIALTLALVPFHTLPESADEKSPGTAMLGLLKNEWKKNGISFPNRFEVVVCHEVILPNRIFGPGHAGLLFPRAKVYTYLEKAGVFGPFVRLDFEERSDLLEWLSATFVSYMLDSRRYVTFNDTRIDELKAAR